MSQRWFEFAASSCGRGVVCRAGLCRCLPQSIAHPDVREGSGHRCSLQAAPWRGFCRFLLRQSLLCLADQGILDACLCGGPSWLRLQRSQKFRHSRMCRDALGNSCLIRRDGRRDGSREGSRDSRLDRRRCCRTGRGLQWLGHCCPGSQILSQFGLACGRGGVSKIRPGLIHGPRPSSVLPLQRLWILAAVDVVADAGDHAAASKKNA